jgi:hypothetical protein
MKIHQVMNLILRRDSSQQSRPSFLNKKIVANRRLNVVVVIVVVVVESLVCEVSGDGDGDGHEGKGEVDGLGAVAAVSLALAHQRVVLLEDGLERKRDHLISILTDSITKCEQKINFMN